MLTAHTGCRNAVTPRLVVPAISQLTAPRAIRTASVRPRASRWRCVSRARYDSAQAADACYHAPSHLFGVWPLASRCAAAAGGAAARMFLPNSTTVARSSQAVCRLSRDPVCTGTLPGAALAATDGHLVVVTGSTPIRYTSTTPPPGTQVGARQCPREAFAAAAHGTRRRLRAESPLVDRWVMDFAAKQRTSIMKTEPRVFVRPVVRGDADEFPR